MYKKYRHGPLTTGWLALHGAIATEHGLRASAASARGGEFSCTSSAVAVAPSARFTGTTATLQSASQSTFSMSALRWATSAAGLRSRRIPVAPRVAAAACQALGTHPPSLSSYSSVVCRSLFFALGMPLGPPDYLEKALHDAVLRRPRAPHNPKANPEPAWAKMCSLLDVNMRAGVRLWDGPPPWPGRRDLPRTGSRCRPPECPIRGGCAMQSFGRRPGRKCPKKTNPTGIWRFEGPEVVFFAFFAEKPNTDRRLTNRIGIWRCGGP